MSGKHLFLPGQASGQAFAYSFRVTMRYNLRTRRVISNPKGIKRRVKIIVRVGIGMKMPTLMTRTHEMLGGTSNLNVRLSFLASYVRMITSLTCALG